MNTRLLPRTNTNRLSIFNIADGIRLRVFQSNQRNQKITYCILRNFFIDSRTIYKQLWRNFSLITVLFKSYTKYIFRFLYLWNIRRINFDNIISALTFSF